jgi:hypothetical protein
MWLNKLSLPGAILLCNFIFMQQATAHPSSTCCAAGGVFSAIAHCIVYNNQGKGKTQEQA